MKAHLTTTSQQALDAIDYNLMIIGPRGHWALIAQFAGDRSGALNASCEEHANPRLVRAYPLRQPKAVHRPREVGISKDEPDRLSSRKYLLGFIGARHFDDTVSAVAKIGRDLAANEDIAVGNEERGN